MNYSNTPVNLIQKKKKSKSFDFAALMLVMTAIAFGLGSAGELMRERSSENGRLEDIAAAAYDTSSETGADGAEFA